MPCTKDTVKASGFNVWSEEAAGGPVPDVDIIAVQGLGADPYWTWVRKTKELSAEKPERPRDKARFWKSTKSRDKDQGDDSAECMWIRDLLVPEFKNARVATYSYKSDFRDRTLKTSLRKCSDLFLTQLSQLRQKKQALVSAASSAEFRDLGLSVAGIIFLGAPFRGSIPAIFGKWLARATGSDHTLLELLQTDSWPLYDIERDFCGCNIRWDTVCVYETRDSNYGPVSIQTVTQHSATRPGFKILPLDTDHTGLNKFGGDTDESYLRILPEIRRMVENGDSTVAAHYDLVGKGTSDMPSGNVHWRVPKIVNNLFTGRTELLVRIKAALTIDNTSTTPQSDQKRFVITGMGGQGKSEICLHVVNMMRQGLWGIFWVDVDKLSTAERDFIAIAKVLGKSIENIPDVLNLLANTRQSWLLVLDNADDPGFDYEVYFPPGTHGAVLMTSRIPECNQYSPNAFEALEGLGPRDAKDLILKAANLPVDTWQSYDAQAQNVAQLLGYHALALVQAGAYISQSHCNIQEYPDVYKTQRQRLLTYKLKQNKPRYVNVYATFEASAAILEQSLEESAKDAIQLLKIVSMLDSSFLPLRLFEEAWKGSKRLEEHLLHSAKEDIGETDITLLTLDHISQLPSFVAIEGTTWDHFRLVEAMSRLVSLSLVTQQSLDGDVGLSMHPLTHAWAKDRQSSECQGVVWISTGCVLGLSCNTFFVASRDFLLTQARQLTPHILSYIDIDLKRVSSFGSKEVLTPLVRECGSCLRDLGQDLRLSQLMDSLLFELELNPLEPSERFLALYDLQANNLVDLRKDKVAVALLEKIVKIKEKTLPEAHTDRLLSQRRLATAYRYNNQVTIAIELLEKIVEVEENTQFEMPLGRLFSQHELANAYLQNGDTTKAIGLFKQVVSLHATFLPENDRGRLASQHELARAYFKDNQTEEAILLLKQVVKILEKTLPETHPDRLTSENVLANAYLENKQVGEAIQLLEQVVSIQETTLHQTNPNFLASQHELARAYLEDKQTEKSIQLFQRVVKTKKDILHETDYKLLVSERSLACAYLHNKQWREAITLLEHVVKINETILPETHSDRLSSQHELAVAYRESGQVAESITLFEHVVKINETMLPETQSDYLSSQHELAIAYGDNGQVAEALTLTGKVVRLRRLVLPADHPKLKASERNLSYYRKLLRDRGGSSMSLEARITNRPA